MGLKNKIWFSKASFRLKIFWFTPKYCEGSILNGLWWVNLIAASQPIYTRMQDYFSGYTLTEFDMKGKQMEEIKD